MHTHYYIRAATGSPALDYITLLCYSRRREYKNANPMIIRFFFLFIATVRLLTPTSLSTAPTADVKVITAYVDDRFKLIGCHDTTQYIII